MKFRTTVILALVAAALAIYLVLSERPAREVRQKEEEMVFSLRGEDVVQKVKLRTSHGVVVLEKLKSDPVTKEARWGLVEPVKARADNPTVSAIVSKLEFLRKVRTLAGEEAERLAPSDTGLDSTALEVTLWDKTGKEETLSVGKENPLGKNLFARVSGKKEIYLVDLSLRETLDKGLDALRSKQIVELVPFKVNSAVIETQGKEAMRLVKKDSIWEFTKPVEVRADAEKVDRLLNDLKELKVLEFLPERPDDAAAFGLDKPTSTFSFEMDGESQTVLFSRRTEKVKVGEKEEEREKGYAMVQGEPTIYSIEPYQVSAFAPEFASLRDRHVVYFSTFDVTELSVKNPTAEVAFKKEEFEWKMTSPKTVPADRTAVGDLLDKLEGLRVKEFVSDNPADMATYGLDKPTVTLSWTRTKEGEKGSLFFGRTDAEKNLSYISVEGGTAIYVVDADFARLLERGPLVYRDRKIFDFPTWNVRDLALERSGNRFAIKLRETVWFLTEPVEAKGNEEAILKVVADLASLKCDSYLTDEVNDPAPYGLATPSYSVEVRLEDGSEHKLQIGKAVTDTTFAARLPDGDAIFSVAKTLVDDLEAEFHNLEVFNFEPKDIERLVLKGKDSVEIVRREGIWRLEGPTPLEVDLVKLAGILDSLKGLKAVRYSSYSPADLAPFGLVTPSVTVEVHLKEGVQALLVGSRSDTDFYYAKSPDSPSVFLVAASVVEPLLGDAQSFAKQPRQAEPESAPPAEKLPVP